MDSVNDKNEEVTILKNRMKQDPLNELGIMSERVETAICKVKEMRNIDFKEGFNFIIENIEKLGMAALEEIAFPDEENHQEILFNRITADIVEEILGYRYSDNEYSNFHYIVSFEFIRGMTVAARKLLEKSKEITFESGGV